MKSHHLRRAKILVTMGPALEEPARLEAALKAGANAVRINFSHGDSAQHVRYLKLVRAAAEKLGRPCAVLADLMGPKIRVDKQSYMLTKGETVTLRLGKGEPESGVIGLTHAGWFRNAKAGQRVLLDDGKLELQFLGPVKPSASKAGKDKKKETVATVRARVIRGGLLKPGKSLNVPGVDLGLPMPTTKDRGDLKVIQKAGFDWIAASFVSSAEDVRKLRAYCDKLGVTAPIISKIENAAAVERLEEIVEASDGVMVARGDLGVEVELERIPTLQRNVIHAARSMGKVTIVATQMLETMMESPLPTRAEVTDVSTAALARVDSLMLSGETAAGKYPIETIAMMDRIIRMAERNLEEDIVSVPYSDPMALMCEAGLYLSLTSGASALITISTRGGTPRYLASYRGNVPTVAACTNEEIYNRSTLYYAMNPILIAPVRETETVFRKIETDLKRKGLVKRGDVMVFVFGYPIHGKHRTNTIRRWEVT
ncbi:MAG TPA: pyruvate kinase [Fibrobacteria bacterium]|jgi:pyruvate kinase|nr:pyruvate kinase [Fibrobacteria bacterium]